MATLLDLFGFLSVLLHGAGLVTGTGLLGGIAFALLLAVPLSARMADHGRLLALTGGGLRIAALAALAVTVLATGLNALALRASMDLPWREVAGAGFVLAGAAKALVALAVLVLAGALSHRAVQILLIVLAAAFLAGDLSESHAAARPVDRLPTAAATLLHQIGAAVWLGGLPWFLAALGQGSPGMPDALALARIGRRYSAMSIAGVGLILAGAVLITVYYIGSPSGFYGTAYGAMAATKSVLMALLLLLGLGNFLVVRQFARGDRGAPERTARVRRAVQVEIGIGIAVLLAASSITSLPPAVDLTQDRVTAAEILERMTPRPPRLSSPDHADLAIPALQATLDRQWQEGQGRPQAFVPGGGTQPPRNASDIAWSEYNHHWAGVVVLLIGIAATLERTGRVPAARHWPLLFLGLAAFLFFRADPEVWPMGSLGLIESLKDPEVVQHRIFVVMIVAFAFFEWGVRTGRLARTSMKLVFPAISVIGGTLLLTHSHALANVKEQLLIELSHLPMGVLGIVAGWTRYLQIKAPADEGRWAGWVWPVCFAAVGLLLLVYREA